MRALVLVALLATPAAADDTPRSVRGETIIIRDHAPGYKLPVPRKDPRIAPEYSDAAIEHDAWTRAWMVLDIDDKGTVQRVQWLERPGYDLEKIALDRAFKTKFEPARDGLGRAQPARLVYPIEWPSYWWLITHTGFATRIPVSAGGVPCRGDGPLNLDRAHPVYRDCSLPDLSRMTVEPWIDRPRQ